MRPLPLFQAKWTKVAAMACWIVSPEASFNTGFTFDLSGGRAVY
jgi:hypothetical protein